AALLAVRAAAQLRRVAGGPLAARAPRAAALSAADGDRVGGAAPRRLDGHASGRRAGVGRAGFVRSAVRPRGGEGDGAAVADPQRRPFAARRLRCLPRVPRAARRSAAPARGGGAGPDGGSMKQARVLLGLLLAGCAFGSHRDAGPRGNPDEALARLDAAETAAQKDPALLARAGWLRYLIASDPRGAELKLQQASTQGPAAGRALALAGLGEIAEDRT